MKLKNMLMQTGIAISLISLVPSSMMAQTNQGQIAGSITDPSGAVIPNATVEAKNDSTGSTYTAKSTATGDYRFPHIALGTYTVTVTAQGFEKQASNGVLVQIGTTTPLNIKLSVGTDNTVVEVDASGTGVETETSDVGGVVQSKQIEELPLALGGLGQLRAIESFVFLIPGTVGPGTATTQQGSGAAQGAGIYLSKIGGGQNFAAQVLVDGLSTQREENGSTFDEISPSVEAIREFQVTTSTPQAQYGRTSGGIENFATRSGVNVYHGSAFDIFRNTALDANYWFNNGNLSICLQQGVQTAAACSQQNKRTVDQKNDYGAVLSGPVRIPHLYNGIDKTFFFFSFEQFEKHQGFRTTSTVPTLLERQGNFTEILAAQGTPTGQVNPCTGLPNLNGQIFDPSTSTTSTISAYAGQQCRTQFMYGGVPNVINPAQITAVGKAIINAYPLPQNAGLSNNYVFTGVQQLANTTYTGRVDENLTAKVKLYASYNMRENTVPFGGTAPQYPGPAGGNIIQDLKSEIVRTGFDYIISPKLLNTFLFGVNRINNDDLSSEISQGVNFASQLGITGINSDAFPNIIPQNGVSALGAATNTDHTELHFLLNDAVTLQLGRNDFKFGIDFRYTQFIAKGATNANGQIYGYNPETADAKAGLGHAAGTGFGLAGLELGLPDYVRVITAQDPKWITKYTAGYIQDDLKATQNLTLNLGLRYEVDMPRHEARNMTSNFSANAIDPVSGLPGALIFGTNCNCNTAWATTYFKDIGPRIGFAYSPSNSNGKTVLRGGGAILYAPLLYADFGGGGTGNVTLEGYTGSLGVAGDGFNPALNLNTGIPAFTNLPNFDPGQQDNGNAAAPTSDTEYIEPSFGRNGMISEWNLQVQQELARDTIFTIGYIGQSGQNLPSFLLQLNNIPAADLALGDRLGSSALTANGITAPYRGFNGTVGQALRPFPQYGNLDTPSDIENKGHTSYDALVTSIDHRARFGLTFNASFTWSKTITDADSAIGGINGGTQALIQNSYNLKTAKSISIQDIPHNFVVNYLYDLPIGKNKAFGGHLNRLTNALVSGITVGGIQRYLSGVPFSIGCASGAPDFNDCLSLTQLPGSSLRSGLNRHTIQPFVYIAALTTASPAQGPDSTRDSIFNGLLQPAGTNTAYAALQKTPALLDQNLDVPSRRNGGPYLFGNLPRVTGQVRNFAYLQEDFVFIKNTPLIGDRYRFQFKTECLDCFNRHNFNAPDANPNNADFGVPLSAVGGTTDGFRRLQLTGRITF